MNKYELLKNCNSKKECIRYCSSCLGVRLGNSYCNVEKLLLQREELLSMADLNCETEIYSKSYIEMTNLYELLNKKSSI